MIPTPTPVPNSAPSLVAASYDGEDVSPGDKLFALVRPGAAIAVRLRADDVDGNISHVALVGGGGVELDRADCGADSGARCDVSLEAAAPLEPKRVLAFRAIAYDRAGAASAALAFSARVNAPPALRILAYAGSESPTSLSATVDRRDTVAISLRASDDDGNLAYIALTDADGDSLHRQACDGRRCDVSTSVTAPSRDRETLSFTAAAADALSAVSRDAAFTVVARARGGGGGGGGGSPPTPSDAPIADTTPPTVSAVAFHNAPASGDTRYYGESVEIAVTFSESVAVSAGGGAPTIGLRVGDKTVAAARVAGHAGESDDRMILAYATVAGDRDSDGLSVLANTLAAPDGSSITDSAGNALVFGANPAVAPDDWQKVGPLVANAGADSNALELTAAALDASGSCAFDAVVGCALGAIASYRWEQTASGAPAIALSDAAAIRTSFTVPESWRDRTYTLRLTVTDASGNVARDVVSVLGRPQPGVETGGVSGNTAAYGSAAEFDVRLESRPTADVTIPVSSSDTSEGVVDAARLTFTPNDWREPKRVTARGRNRNAVGGVQDYEIVLGDAQSADAFYNGMKIANVPMKGVSLEISAPAGTGALTAGALAVIRPRTDYTGRGALAHSLAAAPSGMTIGRRSGEIAWTPTDSDEGEDVAVIVSVTDGDLFAHVSFTLAVMDATPLETQIADGVLTITDTGTNLRGMSVKMAATLTPSPTPAPPARDGAPGSAFVFPDSTDPGTTSATTTVSSLRLEKAPAESVPDTPPWITPISDAFVIKTAIAAPVELRFPITGLPAGVALDDVEFYAYVEPLLRSGPGSDAPQWLAVARDYRYEGTAQNPVYVAELGGVYQGVAMLGHHRTNFEEASASVAEEETRLEYKGVDIVCGRDEPDKKTCAYRDREIIVQGLKDAQWGDGSKDVNESKIAKWILEAQYKLSEMGMGYANSITVKIHEIEGYGLVHGLNPNVLELSSTPPTDGLHIDKMRATAVHELFHHSQYHSMGLFGRIFNPYNISRTAKIRDWLTEGSAQWFVDEVYDNEDLYLVERGIKEAMGEAQLKQGLANPPGRNQSYARATFFKLLDKACPKSDDRHIVASVFQRIRLFTNNGLSVLIDELDDHNCNFGDHLGEAKSGSLEAAFAYYNYATMFFKPPPLVIGGKDQSLNVGGKISLLDRGADESDCRHKKVDYEGLCFRRPDTFKISDPLPDHPTKHDLPIYPLGDSLRGMGAYSFFVPKRDLPEGKKSKITITSSYPVTVSIVGAAANGEFDVASNGKNTIGPDEHERLHYWFIPSSQSARPSEYDPVLYRGSFTYGVPGGKSPELMVTLVNSARGFASIAASVRFETINADGQEVAANPSARWATEIAVKPSSFTSSGGDVDMYVSTEEAGGGDVSQTLFTVSSGPDVLETVYATTTPKSKGCSPAADPRYARHCWEATVSLPPNTSTTTANTYTITASAASYPALTETKTASVSVAAASAAPTAATAWDAGGVTLSPSELPAGGGDVVATVYTRESGGETVSGVVFNALGAGGSVSKMAASCGESAIAAPAHTRRCWNATLAIPANAGDGAAAYTVAATSGQVDGSVSAAIATASPLRNGLIAFASNRDGNTEIYVMDADGSNQRRLTNNPATDHDPNISPDGRRIVFQSNRDGGNRREEIYTMTADGSNVARLTNNTAEEWNPAWSPDGRQIVFESQRDGNAEIYVMDADGANQRRLTNNGAHDNDATWSPDGRRIAFVSNRDGNQEIYVMNADGSNLTRLTNNTYSDTVPAWSLVGGKIAFSSDRDGNRNIYAMDEDGSNQTRLTNHSANEWRATWSPDGRWLAFKSERDRSDGEIYTMNADGADIRRLTNNAASDYYPSWGAARRVSFSLSSTAPSAATVGQSFDVVAQVHGVGGSGDNGGISVSFPSLAGGSKSSGRYTSSAADVRAVSTTGWDDVSLYKSGDTIWASTGRSFPAAHLLVEASDDTWSSSSDRTLRLRVTPKVAGDFAIRIRGWICDDRDCARNPAAGGGARDQQGHAVTVKTVSVSASSP